MGDKNLKQAQMSEREAEAVCLIQDALVKVQIFFGFDTIMFSGVLGHAIGDGLGWGDHDFDKIIESGDITTESGEKPEKEAYKRILLANIDSAYNTARSRAASGEKKQRPEPKVV